MLWKIILAAFVLFAIPILLALCAVGACGPKFSVFCC